MTGDEYVEAANDHEKPEKADVIVKANKHNKTVVVVESVNPSFFVATTDKAWRESGNDCGNNTSYLTPLLQDHLSTETSP